MRIKRYDRTSDTGKEAVKIDVNGKIEELYFDSFDEASALTESLIRLFDLKRSHDIDYEFSSVDHVPTHGWY